MKFIPKSFKTKVSEQFKWEEIGASSLPTSPFEISWLLYANPDFLLWEQLASATARDSSCCWESLKLIRIFSFPWTEKWNPIQLTVRIDNAGCWRSIGTQQWKFQVDGRIFNWLQEISWLNVAQYVDHMKQPVSQVNHVAAKHFLAIFDSGLLLLLRLDRFFQIAGFRWQSTRVET